MGRINVKIPDSVDRRFREAIFRRKGMRKGNLTKAIEEAMLMWVGIGEADEEEAQDAAR